MSWTTPRTWVAGEVVTAAIMNTHVRDDLAYLHGDVGSASLVDTLLFGASGKGTLMGLRHTQAADRHVCTGSIAMPSDSGSGSSNSATFDRAFASTPVVAIATTKDMNTVVSVSTTTVSASGSGSAGTWTVYYIAIGAS